MIFGYMRKSTKKESQKTDRQEQFLNDYAKKNKFEFDEIVTDVISGKTKAQDRPNYKILRGKLRLNDILIVTDLDRLGRNADDMIIELKSLKAKGVKVVILDIPHLNDFKYVVATDSMYDMISDIFITLKAHMAQQEREKIVSRINQGLAVAKAKGKKLGRPTVDIPDNFIKEYKKFKNGEYGKISATKFAKMMNIGRSTLYKYIKILDKLE